MSALAQATPLLLCAITLALPAFAQAPRGGGDFQITKINRNLITAPQYNYTGAQQ